MVRPPQPGVFSPGELDGLPEPVLRYLNAAVAPGTPLARTARIRMHGTIRIGRWLPFRAHEVISPHTGFVWSARAAGGDHGARTATSTAPGWPTGGSPGWSR